MKKSLLSLAVLALMSFSSVRIFADVEHPNRSFYGFFLNNGAYSNGYSEGDYGFAKQSFDGMMNNELILPFGNSYGVYAATAIDGVYYGMPYLYTSSLSAPEPAPMFKYNLYTGVYEEVGSWYDATAFDINFKVNDMTYDMKNDRLLALGYSSKTGSVIYEVNRSNGKLTELRKVNITAYGSATPAGVIAADAHGRVFIITTAGILYQIPMDSQTSAIKLFDTELSGLMSNQSLEFDITCNKLYWASNTIAYDNAATTQLFEFTMPNISADVNYKSSDKFTFKNIGEIGIDGRFNGLYIPYCKGGFNAPGYATDTKFESDAENLGCTITFKAPTTTFGGDPIDPQKGLSGYDIYRNGVRIAESIKDIEPGKECTYTDNTVETSGEYRYDIVCYSNYYGDGPKTPVFAYVGHDKPAAVSDLKVEVSDDFRSTKISWTAPTRGHLDGSFDPSQTRYDIFRLPDNVLVAENLEATEFTDNIKRLLRYSYRVTAKNEVGGSSVTTDEFIAGKPVTVFPVDETFDNPTATLLKWVALDNNHDGLTWMWGADYSHSVFGDYEMAANYILSPTSMDPNTQDADDWIISPPIQFGDDDYSVLLEIRSMYPEWFEVYAGPKNSPEGMTLVKRFSATEPTYGDTGRMLFNQYVIGLPESLKNNIGCVAFRLATKLQNPPLSFVQVGAITIDATSELTDAVSTVVADKNSVKFDGNNIHISGAFHNAALYNANGMKILDIHSENTSLAGLSNGIYILNIDGKSIKLVK